MSLTASQLRIVLVIIISCIAINLLLYTSTVFSATRTTDQTNSIALSSGHQTHHDHHATDQLRVFTKPRSWRGRKHKLKASKTHLRKGWDWNPESRLHNSAGQYGAGLKDRRPSSLGDEDSANQAAVVSKASGAGELSEDFNLDNALRLFNGCLAEGDEITIDCFNDAYDELSKMFKPLGTIFTFVTSEIREKISILRDYRRHPVHGPHFRTVQSMVRYEMDHKLTAQADQPSGSRTFLRLHWALQFISALVTLIKDAGESSKFSNEATQAYDQTLAKHHPWYTRQAIHLAMYALPDKRELLEKLHMEDSPEVMAKVQALIARLDALYGIAQQLYTRNGLMDLP